MIFLAGGGDIEDSKQIDEIFFKYISENDKILYIPTALDSSQYEEAFIWFQSLVKNYQPNIRINMLTESLVYPNLNEYKAIYIGGGNTYKLLQFLCEHKLDEKLKLYEKEGGIIYGGSAGAIILGKTIKTVKEEKEFYPDNEALNLVTPYTVRCHYISQEEELFSDISKKLNSPLLALPENSGVIIEGEKFQTIGNVFIFKKGIKSVLNLNSI
ncbi:MAG: Type 1 glutamine amidotransferase-like domain-containing protein [Alphaproteobacteria bacterium]